MRAMLMAGTAGLLLAFGAAGAANATNPNVPTWSPYAIMAYDAAPAPQATGYSGTTESRAAYLDGAYHANSPATPNSNVPTWSAYSIMPQGQ
jgi:hypothetical protein